MAASGKSDPLISLAFRERKLQCVSKGEGGFGNHCIERSPGIGFRLGGGEETKGSM
jgi:hypothetical protein